MGNFLLILLIFLSALGVLYVNSEGLTALFSHSDAPNAPASPKTPIHPRRPREQSDMWQKEYPISPHRNALPVDSPYHMNRRERRVLRNIINAGVHKMDVKHRKRMTERENAKLAEDESIDSFEESKRERAETDASGYFSDVSEPYDQSTFDDSFANLDSAPYYSEDDGEYSQYPILQFDDAHEESVIEAATPLTAHRRAMFERQNKKTPSKVSEIIERGSDKTLRGRRRERLHRQRSRGLQGSASSVPRRLNFSPHYRSAQSLPQRFAESPELCSAQFVEPVRPRDKGKEKDEASDLGVQSVKNYAAQINSRLRDQQ